MLQNVKKKKKKKCKELKKKICHAIFDWNYLVSEILFQSTEIL